MKIITRTVWVLSFVSLFTDVASEMLYPVMPVYLKEIGFTIFLIGILEGVAEATAGLSKSYFGKLSDVSGKRLPFVRLGYLFSAVSKPMMALFVYPLWIFFARTTDRIGKGLRTGARDAMLSEEATPQTKGQVFGLHRAMDTLGAVLGPAAALVFLYFYPKNYQTLFYLAFFPGLLAILFTFLIREKNKPVSTIRWKAASLFSFFHYWKQSPLPYRKLLIGLLVFSCINSSDVFLLLKIKMEGFNDTTVIGVYIFYNLVYSISAFPVGKLSDRIGFKKTFGGGLILFALVYTGMAYATKGYQYMMLFFLYGLYAAATESVAKAWISNITDKKDIATAIGTYTGLQSICLLIASSLAGWIWLTMGAAATFIFSGCMAILVLLYLSIFLKSHNDH